MNKKQEETLLKLIAVLGNDEAFLRTVKKSPYLCGGSGYIRVNPDGSPSKMGLTHYECPGCPNCNYEEIYCGSLDLDNDEIGE